MTFEDFYDRERVRIDDVNAAILCSSAQVLTGALHYSVLGFSRELKEVSCIQLGSVLDIQYL